MFKYSVAMTNLFGFADSKYSQYFDLSGNFDTGFWGLTVNAHVGRQTVRNLTDGAYTDWKLGLTKDLGQGLAISVAYIDTNADRAVYTNSRGRYMGRATGLAVADQDVLTRPGVDALLRYAPAFIGRFYGPLSIVESSSTNRIRASQHGRRPARHHDSPPRTQHARLV